MATRLIGTEFTREIRGRNTRMITRYIHYLELECGHTRRVTGARPPKRKIACYQCWSNAGHPSPQAP